MFKRLRKAITQSWKRAKYNKDTPETEAPEVLEAKDLPRFERTIDYFLHNLYVLSLVKDNYKAYAKERAENKSLEDDLNRTQPKNVKKVKRLGRLFGVADLATPFVIATLSQLSVVSAIVGMFVSQYSTRKLGAWASKVLNDAKLKVALDTKESLAKSFLYSTETDLNNFKTKEPKVSNGKAEYLDKETDVARKLVSLTLSISFLLYLCWPAAALLTMVGGYNFCVNLYNLRKRKETKEQATNKGNNYGITVNRILDAASIFRGTNNYEQAMNRIQTEKDVAYQTARADIDKNYELNNKNIPFFALTSSLCWGASLLAGVWAGDVGMALGTFAATMMLSERVLSSASEVIELKSKQTDLSREYNVNMRGLEYSNDKVRFGSKTLSTSRGEVVFNGVNYTYEGSTQGVHDVSLTCSRGKINVIAGESGSGKSTTMKMLTRELDAQEGIVTLDGTDIKDLNQESLLSQISVIQQQPVFLHETIRDEMLIFNRGATDEEIKEALAKVKLEELSLDRLTFENEKATLSGGQLQRLAIARALLRKGSVLLMDEPTANLDAASKQEVWNAIEAIKDEKTVIVVSHDAFEIANADQLVILEEGRITGKGNPSELMQEGHPYLENIQNRVQNSILEHQAVATTSGSMNQAYDEGIVFELPPQLRGEETRTGTNQYDSKLIMGLLALDCVGSELTKTSAKKAKDKVEKNHHLAMRLNGGNQAE